MPNNRLYKASKTTYNRKAEGGIDFEVYCVFIPCPDTRSSMSPLGFEKVL